MFRAVALTNQSLLYDSIGPRHEIPLTSPACQRLRPAHRPRQILPNQTPRQPEAARVTPAIERTHKPI